MLQCYVGVTVHGYEEGVRAVLWGCDCGRSRAGELSSGGCVMEEEFH